MIVRFIVLRLVQLIPVLLGITILAFLLLRVMPGDPATLLLGSRGTAEDIAKLQHQLGLDKPLLVQYFQFLLDCLKGDFGTSIAFRTSVGPLIFDRLWVTLALVAYSTVIAIVLTIPLAFLAALRKNSATDNLIKFLFICFMSMPAFWLGILLVLVFAVYIPVFPVSGLNGGVLGLLHSLFLPALVIALSTAALTVRSLRSSIIAVLNADYIDTAYAKGMSRMQILRRHVFRNSLLSTISVLGVHTSWVIGGTVVIEAVFALPGLGGLMVSSIAARDYPMVQGLTVTFAVLVVLINLAADLAYVAADPRVELS